MCLIIRYLHIFGVERMVARFLGDERNAMKIVAFFQF